MRTLERRLHYKVFDEPKPACDVYPSQLQIPKEEAMSTDHHPPVTPEFAAWIGIDWADQEHAVCVVDAVTGSFERSTLAHEPGAIDIWAAELKKRSADLCALEV
jgi:hypothetical protein